MEIRAHGGGCCGVRHLCGFNTQTTNVKVDGKIETVPIPASLSRLDELLASAPKGRLVEAVLTDNQATIWNLALRERKFVLITRFRNANSGNNCNVYHWMKPEGYSITNEKQNHKNAEDPLNKGLKHDFIKSTLTIGREKPPVKIVYESDNPSVDLRRPLYLYFDPSDPRVGIEFRGFLGKRVRYVYVDSKGYIVCSLTPLSTLKFSRVKGLLRNQNWIRIVNGHEESTVKNPFKNQNADTGREYL